MEWFKLSVRLPRDPKWKLLAPLAKIAYIEWACEVAEQETDGVYLTKPCRVGGQLVDAGLAETVANGYYLPAFLKRNPSHAVMDGKRIAGRAASDVRWGGHAESDAVSDAKAKAKRKAEPSTEVEVEVEVEEEIKEPRSKTLAPRTARRERDPIWDCLVAAFGEPTASARGARNAAAKVLRDYAADPDDIADFVTACAGGANDWAVKTPTAVAKHFGSRATLMRSTAGKNGTAIGRDLAVAARLREEGR